jgi:hypothetical protein
VNFRQSSTSTSTHYRWDVLDVEHILSTFDIVDKRFQRTRLVEFLLLTSQCTLLFLFESFLFQLEVHKRHVMSSTDMSTIVDHVTCFLASSACCNSSSLNGANFGILMSFVRFSNRSRTKQKHGQSTARVRSNKRITFIFRMFSSFFTNFLIVCTNFSRNAITMRACHTFTFLA